MPHNEEVRAARNTHRCPENGDRPGRRKTKQGCMLKDNCLKVKDKHEALEDWPGRLFAASCDLCLVYVSVDTAERI